MIGHIARFEENDHLAIGWVMIKESTQCFQLGRELMMQQIMRSTKV